MAEIHDGIPFVDVTIDTEQFAEGARPVLQVIRPQWKVQDIVFKKMFGGHMNLLMRCHVASDPDDKILIRVNSPMADKFVDRETEYYYMRELAKLGLAQPFYCRFANGMAYKYAEGEPVTAENQGDPHVSSLVIAQYHKLHAANVKPCSGKPPTGMDFWHAMMTPVQSMVEDRWYEQHNEFPGKEELLGEFKFTLAQYEELIKSKEMVLCHNDLVIGNIIYDKEKDTVSFIDWEYCGFGTEAFDICLQLLEWSGFVPTKEYIRDWLKRYLQTHPKRAHPQHPVSEEEVQSFYEDYLKGLLVQTLVAVVWAMFEWKEGEDKSREQEYKDIIFLYLRQYYATRAEVEELNRRNTTK